MTVSAVSDEEPDQKPKPRKQTVFLKESQWIAARHQYESEPCSDARSVERLMLQYNVSERTVRLKIAKQGWKKGAVVAHESQNKLHQIVAANLEPIGKQIAERIGAKVEDDLAPWLAREKLKWTKQTHALAKSRRRMVQAVVESLEAITPKDAAYIAKADDTYDNMGRRTLGMSSENGFSGNLNVQILAGQAAVQLSQS